MSTNFVHASFVDRFETAWSTRSVEALGGLLHPDVRLAQPLVPPLQGRAAAMRSLGTFIALMPDLRVTVHRWSADAQFVFIEFSFQGTVGRRAVQLDIVDRIELVDGQVRDRTAYFNPAPLVRAVLTQPWLLTRLLA